jgi:hypothetical protein
MNLKGYVSPGETFSVSLADDGQAQQEDASALRRIQELEVWKSVQHNKTPQACEQYLRQYPNGLYANEAAACVSKLDLPAAGPKTFTLMLQWRIAVRRGTLKVSEAGLDWQEPNGPSTWTLHLTCPEVIQVRQVGGLKDTLRFRIARFGLQISVRRHRYLFSAESRESAYAVVQAIRRACGR